MADYIQTIVRQEFGRSSGDGMQSTSSCHCLRWLVVYFRLSIPLRKYPNDMAGTVLDGQHRAHADQNPKSWRHQFKSSSYDVVHQIRNTAVDEVFEWRTTWGVVSIALAANSRHFRSENQCYLESRSQTSINTDAITNSADFRWFGDEPIHATIFETRWFGATVCRTQYKLYCFRLSGQIKHSFLLY